MLVLTRKAQESVVIGGHDASELLLTITVLEIRGERVRLGFQADSTVAVHRWEVWQVIQANGRQHGPTPEPAPPGTG